VRLNRRTTLQYDLHSNTTVVSDAPDWPHANYRFTSHSPSPPEAVAAHWL
jgi:hypothetical protein